MDKIKIVNLEVFANHGVLEEEQKLGQKFLVTAILSADTRAAGLADNLNKSIHYGEVAEKITAFLRKENWQLIETVAEKLAEELLTMLPNLREICLEIQKPWAPVLLPLETVAVEITRGWHEAYISLGSNLGNRQRYLEEAIEQLKADSRIRVKAVSSFIDTDPEGVTEQPVFLNACMRIETLHHPHELLAVIHTIEAAAGRVREIHWGPRTLDLDLLLYDDLVQEDENLVLPHPRMHLRTFVLEPMTQIAPWKRHPIKGETMEMLLEGLRHDGFK